MTAAGPRGPGNKEGGGFAAAHSLEAAALRPGDAPRQGYGAAPPASRLLRTACGGGLTAGPDPGDLGGPAGRKGGQAPACPACSAPRPRAGDRRSPLTSGKAGENRRSSTKNGSGITRNSYEEVSTVLGEPRLFPGRL